ncbi:MAG: hypothetical protein V1696_03830 [Candidatus Jorgensenbacteria bacterium]
MTYVILPIKKADGSIITISCLQCAEQSPAYCVRHKSPHLGFEGGGTACRLCIEDLVRQTEGIAGSTYRKIQEELPAEEFQKIEEAAEVSSLMTGNGEQVSVLRFLATKALRTGTTIEGVVKELLFEKSAEVILR